MGADVQDDAGRRVPKFALGSIGQQFAVGRGQVGIDDYGVCFDAFTAVGDDRGGPPSVHLNANGRTLVAKLHAMFLGGAGERTG
jgi:hypothetical protein